MKIRSPVRGFTPCLGPRSATANLPKPVKFTSPPPWRTSVMASSTASTAWPASFLLPILESRASTSRNSALVTCSPPRGRSSAPSVTAAPEAKPSGLIGLLRAADRHLADEDRRRAHRAAERDPARLRAHREHRRERPDQIPGDGELAQRLGELAAPDGAARRADRVPAGHRVH